MEELQIYHQLVKERGDPFTVFERDYPEDDEDYGSHALREDRGSSQRGSR